MNMEAADESEEFRRMYGEDPAPVYSPPPTTPRRRPNRRGSVTEHIIRAQQEYLNHMKAQNQEANDLDLERKSVVSFQSFQNSFSNIGNDLAPPHGQTEVENEHAGVMKDGSLEKDPATQFLVGSYTKNLPSGVCDVDMETYQTMRSTTSSRCSTTRAA